MFDHDVSFAYHTVVGGSAVDKQALQQNLGDAEILSLSIERNIQAFAELPHRLFPVSVFKKGIALLQQVAHQLRQEVLGKRKKEQADNIYQLGYMIWKLYNKIK